MFLYITFYWVFIQLAKPASSQIEDNEIPTSYEEAQVWRIQFKHSDDFITVRNFLGINKLIDEQDISLWTLSPTHMDFLIQPSQKVKVNRILESRKLAHSVLIMDVQRRLDSLKTEPALWDKKTLRLGHRLNWKEYPTLRIINEYFTYLAENFPSICTVTSIGHTAHNNSIQMVKISNGNPNNKVLLIMSGQHAREWVAITSALYVLDNIVTKFDQLSEHLKSVEWWFIPVLNPDGYEYSHTHDRLWRKNRRKFKTCTGVDINRNFNIDWDVPGLTNKNECHGDYAGPHAFSEAESIALKNVITSSEKKPSAFIDVHAYGQLLLFPWSARPNETADSKLLWKTAKSMSNAISKSTGQNYDIGETYHKIYPTSGVAIDWVYSLGVTQSFAMEGKDGDTHGFLAPTGHIEPAGEDLLAAATQLAKDINAGIVKRRGTVTQTWF